MVFDGALEEVEWAIVFVVDEVFHVVFQEDSKFVAIIVLSDLYFGVFVVLIQRLESEFGSIPLFSAS